MKKVLFSTCLVAGFASMALPASAAECGNVTLAVYNYQSAEVLASVDKFILEEGYGCNVDTVPGDTVPTITSMMEKSEPDVSGEQWVDLLPDVIPKGIAEGKLVEGAPALVDGGIQGWWIPKYLADANPDIKTVEDALKRPDLFPDAEDASKGAIINGPQGWGATIVTAQLFKAYKAADKGFKLIDPGSTGGLDGAIAKAYERQEGFMTYYWAPTALLGRYDMVMLRPNAEHDAAEWKRCNTVADCADPKVNAWPVDKVNTILSKSFVDRTSPEVLTYFKTRGWSNDTVGGLMAWMTENQAAGDEGAKHFLKENKDVWSKWVPADVAEKVAAAL